MPVCVPSDAILRLLVNDLRPRGRDLSGKQETNQRKCHAEEYWPAPPKLRRERLACLHRARLQTRLEPLHALRG